ncbi:MAG: DinB family protein [Candidatus Eisenbacteria bacterium]|nr:DinB family protein [Candidatus Eisenbacteria bacterium]
MHPSILQAVQIQGVVTSLFHRALEGVTEEEARIRPGDDSNPMLWMAGHLVTTRVYLAKLVGVERPLPWNGTFARSAALDMSLQLPALAEVCAAWDDISAALAARFEQLTDAELKGPAGEFPSLDQTVRGALAMAALHDSYHVGQMAFVRKFLGHGRLVG